MIAHGTRGALRPYVSVDTAALLRNYAKVCALAAPARVMGVLKSNAYGMGLEKVAELLTGAGCAEFVVARLDEGRRVRRINSTARIYCWQGLCAGALDDYLALELTPVLNSPGAVRTWAAHPRAAYVPAAVYVDTGLSRLGLSLDELETLWDVLAALPVHMWFTHLSYLDAADHPFNAQQIARFEAALAHRATGELSVAGSMGAWMSAADRKHAIRSASALAGIMPPAAGCDLEPVLRLEAHILTVRDLAAGTPVGYEEAGRLERAGIVATAAAGYADGLANLAGGEVEYQGRRYPIIGDLSMDLLMFDAGDAPQRVRPGETITIFGGAVSLQDHARYAGWSEHAVVGRLHPDLPRVYL